MTTNIQATADGIAKLWRDIAALKQGIAECKASQNLSAAAAEPRTTPPADAQSEELRVHATSKASLLVRECQCEVDACACEDRAFH